MNKKIVSIIIGMLVFATIISVAQPETNSETTPCVASTNPNMQPLLAPGDILLDLDVQTPTADNQCLGGEWDGTNFWVTGGGAAADPNKLYKFDIAGNLLTTYNQPSAATGWGIRDLAYDGTYLYGGCEYGFWQIDPATGTFTQLFSSISPIACIRALAWVPSENMFYTANFGASWYKFSPDGSQKIPITNPGLVGEYGMAYDDINDTIWVHDQGAGVECRFIEYDYHTQTLTGKQYLVPLLTGTTSQIAGGAFYAIDIVTGKATLGGVTQGTPNDRLFVMELGDSYSPPVANANGPYTGAVGEPIQFTGSASGGTPPYTYEWDFGNGDTSDEQNPLYTYDSAGVFDVILTVTDDDGTTDTDETTATIIGPEIEIRDISGKIGHISVSIKNIGTVDITDITWTISLEGGLIILGKESTGTIPTLNMNVIADFQSKFIFGFGKPTITVKVETTGFQAEKTATATVLLFFVLNVA